MDVSKIKSQHFISYLRNIFADFLSHISLLNVMHFRKRKRTDVIFDFVHNIAVPNFTLISIEQPGFVLPIMIFLQSLLLFLLPGWYSPRPPNPLSLARFRSLATWSCACAAISQQTSSSPTPKPNGRKKEPPSHPEPDPTCTPLNSAVDFVAQCTASHWAELSQILFIKRRVTTNKSSGSARKQLKWSFFLSCCTFAWAKERSCEVAEQWKCFSCSFGFSLCSICCLLEGATEPSVRS